MNKQLNIPLWLQPIKLESFPVRRMNNNVVQCRLALPRMWGVEPEMNENPIEIEHIFQGIEPMEFLVLNFMEKADPQRNLRDWLEMILAVTGVPILPMSKLSTPTPKLLKWESLENQNSLCDRFQVDEVYLYQGLAQCKTSSLLLCLYTILARRGTFAWKIGLSLTATEDMLTSDRTEICMADRERAGAILGELSFL